MEIGEFIEQDILIFLDDRIDSDKAPQRLIQGASTLYLTRDYEKELAEAIAKSQPTTAKEVLRALKEQFDAAPEGTPDKEQLKALLTALYERFKDFLDKQQIPVESLMSTPASVPEPDEPPLPPTAPPISPALPHAAPAVPAATPSIAKPGVQSAVLTAALHRIDDALARGEITAAVTAYRDAKREAILHQQPKDSLVRVHAAFGSIKQAIADRAAAQTTMPADPRKEMDKQLLLELEREKRALDTSLHHNSLRDAMQQYKRMRLLVQQISDPVAAKTAAGKLERIFAIINVLRKHDDERRLKATP